jgi:hypothetical protein
VWDLYQVPANYTCGADVPNAVGLATLIQPRVLLEWADDSPERNFGITSLVLYHICKGLYQRTFPKWCSPFYSTPGDGLFSKNMQKSKRCVFVGVSNRKICVGRVLELQRSFQKFSFVPVQKQNDLLETQNSGVLVLLKNSYGCVKIR